MNAPVERVDRAQRYLNDQERFKPIELTPWFLAVAAFYVFGDYMAFGTQLLITIIFALSLDLILGYAGIVTLGHAAYFGVGAYTAGMLSAHLNWNEPLSGLVLSGACAALAGLLSGLVLLRYHGLTLLMLTLATAVFLQQLANTHEDLTGGFDGLLGIAMDPLLGRFEYDLWGHTTYWYALIVLALMFLVARAVVHSNFGRSLAGIRENPVRMRAVGTPVYRRLVTVYTLSAAMAGVAGGLFAQSNAFVTLDVLSFDRSGTILIILILGGTGRLYGAFVGAAVFLILEDELSKINPEFWQLGVGVVLILAVLFARDGLLGLLGRIRPGGTR